MLNNGLKAYWYTFVATAVLVRCLRAHHSALPAGSGLVYALLPAYVLEVELDVLLEHMCESPIAGGDAFALHEHRLLVRGFSTTVREDAAHGVYEAHNVGSGAAHLFY